MLSSVESTTSVYFFALDNGARNYAKTNRESYQS